MAQRNSGYKRVSQDCYVTPEWVWEALYSVEPWAIKAWDCCPVNAMFDVLNVTPKLMPPGDIASNTPYGRLGPRIVRHILPMCLRCAFLFPSDWDFAHGRRDLFEGSGFKAKYAITKRIRWENLPLKYDKHGRLIHPSAHHAWYVWDHAYEGKPFLGYLP